MKENQSNLTGTQVLKRSNDLSVDGMSRGRVERVYESALVASRQNHRWTEIEREMIRCDAFICMSIPFDFSSTGHDYGRRMTVRLCSFYCSDQRHLSITVVHHQSILEGSIGNCCFFFCFFFLVFLLNLNSNEKIPMQSIEIRSDRSDEVYRSNFENADPPRRCTESNEILVHAFDEDHRRWIDVNERLADVFDDIDVLLLDAFHSRRKGLWSNGKIQETISIVRLVLPSNRFDQWSKEIQGGDTSDFPDERCSKVIEIDDQFDLIRCHWVPNSLPIETKTKKFFCAEKN